jgi:anti-anti-sigma factor
MQVYEPVLRIMERSEGDGVVLTVQGEVDLATVDTLRSRLADVCDRHQAVTIDLRRVNFLDCLGLRLLIDQYEEAATCGCHVDFIQGPPVVERVFELTGALSVLPFVEIGRAPLSAVASA